MSSLSDDKASRKRPAGLLQPVEIPEGFWQCVTFDLITQLPVTTTGFDAIAVFVDKLSKMTHIAPCHTTLSSKEFANLFMDNVFRLHVLPLKLLSDRGTQFTSNFM